MFFLSWIGSNIYLLKAELSQRINSSLDGPINSTILSLWHTVWSLNRVATRQRLVERMCITLTAR